MKASYAGLRKTRRLAGPYNKIVGKSSALQSVYDLIERAAAVDVPVLLTGETGTGKGLFARALHFNSPRRNGPFVCIDCTNLPTTLIESTFGHEKGAFTGPCGVQWVKLKLPAAARSSSTNSANSLPMYRGITTVDTRSGI